MVLYLDLELGTKAGNMAVSCKKHVLFAERNHHSLFLAVTTQEPLFMRGNVYSHVKFHAHSETMSQLCEQRFQIKEEYKEQTAALLLCDEV